MREKYKTPPESSFYKIVDLFGNEELVIASKKKAKPNLFSDYDAFLDKFNAPKTTDDCYTPAEVFDIVLRHVSRNFNLKDKKIIRPFYPGGDYLSINYTSDCVVIDNPPFSIITEICRYYINNSIKFFLFCPHMTAFGSNIDCTHIIASANITYQNGAIVKTSFVSNMFGDKKIIGSPELHSAFEELRANNKVHLPKYEYPENVITVSKIAYCVEKGISIEIDKKDVRHIGSLDSQKKHKKGIFGSGFLVSDLAADALKEAKGKAVESYRKKSIESVVWELSEREVSIVKSMSSFD